MFMIDTHTHLYLNTFDEDRKDVVNAAIKNGIQQMLLPNIDNSSIDSMLNLCKDYPNNCFPMMGLHPTSVKENYLEELSIVDDWLKKEKFIAIGEAGIDLYWDKTFFEEQKITLKHQINLAKQYEIPLVIHSRDSFDEIYKIIKEHAAENLTGVFHCFTGNIDQAKKINKLGFLLGIGGVVTFKKSGLDEVVKNLDLESIILETDSPFLAPAPFRGKRNESAYVKLIAQKIAQIKNITLEEVSKITTNNAQQLFNLK